MTETKRPRGRPRKVTLDSIEKPKVMRSDSWDNFVTGLGQKQDRTQYTKYAWCYYPRHDGTLSQRQHLGIICPLYHDACHDDP